MASRRSTRRLHDLVAEASGNPFIQQMLSELYNVSVRELYLSQRPITLVVDEIATYRALVDAICRGDADAAEAEDARAPLLGRSGGRAVLRVEPGRPV